MKKRTNEKNVSKRQLIGQIEGEFWVVIKMLDFNNQLYILHGQMKKGREREKNCKKLAKM